MIKFVIFDFDGVFTNGKCYFDKDNNVIKRYDVKDGMALALLREHNIKTGLISAYNMKKKLLFTENDVNNEIIDHLGFDYRHVGGSNKMEVLNQWLTELNLSYNEIAYIGDDINDIPLLEKVGFSACPNDAINECKNIVDYVCEKKGGDGCVREFVELILNNGYRKNKLMNDIKNEIIYQLKNINIDDIIEFSKTIKNYDTVYFSGIGKSETMANHCCSLLKSIGIKCFSLNATNALHGDIGTINKNDLIMLFSKSGNTCELLHLIPFLKQKGCYTVGICCDDHSEFMNICNKTIRLSIINEIDGAVNKIPTNSCMAQLLFSNILVSLLKNDVTLDQYTNNHPSGKIGLELRKIKDCLITEFPKIIFNNTVNLHEILLEMTKYKNGTCCFVDQDNVLIGIITDGDIRRLLLKDMSKTTINIGDINCNPYYETDIKKCICMVEHRLVIPILNNKKLIGIITLT